MTYTITNTQGEVYKMQTPPLYLKQKGVFDSPIIYNTAFSGVVVKKKTHTHSLRDVTTPLDCNNVVTKNVSVHS